MISNMGLFKNLASNSMEATAFDSTVHHGIITPVSDNQGFYPPPLPPFSLPLNFDPTAGFISSTGLMNMVPPEPEIQVNSSPSHSGIGMFGSGKTNRKNYQVQNCGGKKRKRVGEVEKDKPKEVVHVRAKRGQATDSHSLAERLRREKINEKLRCLQDLVPGCYKTMGMAVMLDVTINYVRSLQNQIDFLSTKLSAASLFYDFNSSSAEAIETIQQQGTNGHEQGMEEKVGGEGNYGGNSQFQAPNWPF